MTYKKYYVGSSYKSAVSIAESIAENEEEKLISIASRSGMGKTTFVLNLLANMVSLNKCNVLLFSLEMSKGCITERLKRNSRLTDEDFERIHIDDTHHINVDYIKKTVSEYDNLSVIFIDYIQLIDNFKISYERESILSELKRICKEKNIHVIFTSKLPRPTNRHNDNRPSLIDIDADSAIIADAVFALFFQPYCRIKNSESYRIGGSDTIEVICLKNSFGDLKKLNLKSNGLDSTYTYDYAEYNAVSDNRNELHLHTKLSNDVSVIGVKDVFEKAEKLGLRAIAFTGLNNVGDFRSKPLDSPLLLSALSLF